MVIRIATFEKKPDVHEDKEKIAQFRAWMKSQPGFRAGYHASDSKTGKSQSISVWDDMPSLLAMKDRTFPGGPTGAKPDSVVILDDVEQF